MCGHRSVAGGSRAMRRQCNGRGAPSRVPRLFLRRHEFEPQRRGAEQTREWTTMNWMLMKTVLAASLIPAAPLLADVENGNPDTVLVIFDEHDEFVCDINGNAAINDNGSILGDGRASALYDIGDPGEFIPGFINNFDGTRSLRFGVSGYPDVVQIPCISTFQTFDGLFSHFSHGEIGRFIVYIEYFNDTGSSIVVETFEGEFVYGFEAIRFYSIVPELAVSASVVIDNDLIEACEPADLNFDGVVDTADLSILLGAFGIDCNNP